MKLIILDRDGVINHDSDAFIKSPAEWVSLPGSIEAIARLSRNGWRVVIATNQSGIGRGLFSMNTLNSIHGKLRREVAAAGGLIDAIFMCPHHPDDECNCRKPLPGLFHDIARRYETSLDGVPTVGDTLRDLQAGISAGCQPWLVLTGKGQNTYNKGDLPDGTRVVDDLATMVNTLLTKD